MRKLRRNPAWSWNFLDGIWEELLTVGGPKMMPIRRNPVVEEYGEGFWGVAMPCVDRSWTLKLTTDASEAFFVAILHGVGLSGSVRGLVRTTNAFDTERFVARQSRKMPVYLYWREAAEFMDADAWRVLAQSEPKHRIDHARNVIIDALDLTRGHGRDPADIRKGISKLTGAKLTRAAGAELRALAVDGVLVTDVHLGNWGIVARAPDQLTMVDPGMVRFTGAAKTLLKQHPPRSLPEVAAARLQPG